MGLDMYVQRISKPHLDDTLVYDYGSLDGILIRASDIEDSEITEITSRNDVTDRKLIDILPYTQMIKVRSRDYDMKKIRRDFGISEQSYISMISNHKMVITDYCDGTKEEIPMSVVESKYVIESAETCLFARCEEVMYWRKAYDVRRWFHDEIPTVVENVGFYILTEDTLDEYNKQFPDDRIFVEAPSDESALFYHEWY